MKYVIALCAVFCVLASSPRAYPSSLVLGDFEVPEDFMGDLPKAIFFDIRTHFPSYPEKKEFETTASHEDRLKIFREEVREKGKKLYFIRIPRSAQTYSLDSYNADTKQFTFFIEGSRDHYTTRDRLFYIDVGRNPVDIKDYVYGNEKNIFGKPAYAEWDKYKILPSNIEKMHNFVKLNDYAGFLAVPYKKMEAEEAKVLKANYEAIAVCSIQWNNKVKGFYKYDTSIEEPTIFEPRKILFRVQSLNAKIHQIWFYDIKSRKVVYKQEVEKIDSCPILKETKAKRSAVK